MANVAESVKTELAKLALTGIRLTGNGEEQRLDTAIPVPLAQRLRVALEAAGLEVSWAHDNDDRELAWVYARSELEERVVRAAADVDATELSDGRWAHYDDGMRRWYTVSAEQLASLCVYLDSDDESVCNDAYSHWCAGTSAQEMPDGWTPDTAEVAS